MERVLPRLAADRVIEIVAAFANESLIRTEGSWERSAFCFRSNPGAVPGVAVLHPEIREVIGLWDRLKIASQPTADDALRWLGSLPLDAPLAEGDRKHVKAVLALYPLDVWTREQRWLSLHGRIVRTSGLPWGCLQDRATAGLFTSVRSETADFSMLDHSRLQTFLHNSPPLIEISIEKRVLDWKSGRGSASLEEPWVHALGGILSRLELKDAEAPILEADRASGLRLARTRWIPASAVQVQPFLNGIPAGSQTQIAIVWIGESLYVDGDSVRAYKALVEELLRQFQTSAARIIIRDCVGRDPAWIEAYASAHLDLIDPAGDSDVSSESPPPAATSSPAPVFPEPNDTRPHESTEEAHPQLASDPISQPDNADAEKTAIGGEAHAHEKKAQPSKLDRLANFLRGRGFVWDAPMSHFVHPDGSFVHRSEGIFPWELISPAGVTPLWLATTNLSDVAGIELPAEIWNAAAREEAVLLSPEGSGYRTDRFADLQAAIKAQTLEVYPAVFRIKVPQEAAEGIRTGAELGGNNGSSR
ncbi:MAG: hypothetical protein M1541_14490 [Acidobacteria bacterium]|nr:hypothetical protein [Acidobacteriota bacterium]